MILHVLSHDLTRLSNGHGDHQHEFTRTVVLCHSRMFVTYFFCMNAVNKSLNHPNRAEEEVTHPSQQLASSLRAKDRSKAPPWWRVEKEY